MSPTTSLSGTVNNPRRIPCTDHGPSNHCYILSNGEHVDAEKCTCFFSSKPGCPVHDRWKP